MSSDKFNFAVRRLRDSIQKEKGGQIRLPYRTFLSRLGIQRRTSASLRLLVTTLGAYGVNVEPDIDGKWTLETLPLDTMLTCSVATKQRSHGSVRSQEPTSKVRRNLNAPTIQRSDETNPEELWKHQKDAILSMNRQIDGRPYAGLLVIPTGGGKTRTAVHWILRNMVDKGIKVLWIAHRDTLLKQACRAFERNAYADLLKEKEKVQCRIVCGGCDRAVRIQKTDDIIFASIQSLRHGSAGHKYLLEKWIKGTSDLFLVIDEAHHAPARTYRELIKTLRTGVKHLRILGLTATPFRAAEREQGLLRKMFTDDIVFSIGLRTLISRGILSEPVFRSPETGVNLQRYLTPREMDTLRKTGFNFDTLGRKTTKTLAENAERNRFIVNHYVKHKREYGQTLVFALNVDNAIALNTLFREHRLSSEYVVSSIYDAAHMIRLDKENRLKIDRFREGKLDILINVNIVTEGVDLPNAQTVFLTRPTSSKVLLMQMIGRGLRGKKANGTDKSFIVSFIDEWEDKIEWANAEQLFINENVDFDDTRRDTLRQLIRFISIEKIEEFARILDSTVDTSGIEALPFIERVPVGVYTFSLLQERDSGSAEDRMCLVLVYSSTEQAYSNFINDLPALFRLPKVKVGSGEWLSDTDLAKLAQRAEDEYFFGLRKALSYRRQDLADILQYYYVYGIKPTLIPFEQRAEFDIDKLAKKIYGMRLDRDREAKHISREWEDSKALWQAFFGFNKKYFVEEVSRALRKRQFPEDYAITSAKPSVEYPKRPIEEFSLEELRETHPDEYRKLKDEVYRRAKDRAGNYVCAITGRKSPYRIDFEIDHKKPMSRGGLTRSNNLQLVLRRENRRKRDKLPGSRRKRAGSKN